MNHSFARRSILAGIAGAAVLTASGVAAKSQPGARAALTRYFELINQRNFRAAFLIWERDARGRNDVGQTQARFAAGFAQTRSVVADIGPEGEGDSGAGSQYLELDVTLTAIQRSGKRQMFEGSYMMRRSPNPGGHQDWKIYSAKLTPADRN